MPDLTLTIIQSDLAWENSEKNRAIFSKKIDSIKEKTDLIILPEMFTTGFSMNAESLAEEEPGTSLQWMIDMAKSKNAVLTGSLIVREKGYFYNRLYWVKNDGKYDFYDKRHLFRMAGEHNIYSAGKSKIITEIKGWKILPLVCYDLRFPVWSRSVQQEYDIIIFVANWPESRSSHWRLLLQARAVENQAYAVGVNRVGIDGLGINYRGDSSIVDPLGKIIKQEADKEFIHSEILQWDTLQRYRQKFPVWMDADLFKIDGDKNDPK